MVGLIVIMMVAQFRGYRRAGIILLTIPLSLIGAAIGLHVMRADFGFMVILGLYSLAGPGGWPLIGRTGKRLFDASREDPFVLSPGAKVVFTAVDAS